MGSLISYIKWTSLLDYHLLLPRSSSLLYPISISIKMEIKIEMDLRCWLGEPKRITSQVRLCWLNQSKDKSQGSNLVRWMMRIDWSPKLLWRRLDQGSATSCPSILLFQLVWNRLVVSHWLIDWWLAIGLFFVFGLNYFFIISNYVGHRNRSWFPACVMFPLLTIGLRLRLVILVLPWSFFFFFKVYRTHHP